MLIMLVPGSITPLHPYRSRRARKGWMIFLSIATFITLFFFVADFAHYAYLRQRLNASVLNYLEDAAISLNMVWETYPVVWMILGMVAMTIVIMLAIRYFYRLFSKTKEPVPRRLRTANFIAMFLVCGFFIFGKFDQYPLRWSDAFALGDDFKANMAFNPFQSFFLH